MSSAFIPLFSKLPVEDSSSSDPSAPLSKGEFYFTISWLLSAVMIVIVLLGIALSDVIAPFFFFLQNLGYDKSAETALLLKILFPYIGFISLVSLQQAVLENHGRFAYSASVPVLFNLITITAAAGVLWGGGEEAIIAMVEELGLPLAHHPEIRELAQTITISLGVMVGGVGQLGYSFWGARRLGYRVWPFRFVFRGRAFRRRLGEYFRHPLIKKFVFLLLPVFLASGSYQIQTLLLEPLAFSLGEGVVSILYYANRLLEFPLGIVGVGITTATLPMLSKAAAYHSPEAKEEFISIIHHAFNLVFVLFLPILIVSLFYPQTIISIVFEFGQFSRQDTIDTALCFLVLIPSIFSLAGYRILFNVFYARENTRSPLIISSLNLFLGLPLAWFLISVYPHPVMISLAATLISFVMLGASLYLLHNRGISLSGFLLRRLLFFLKVTALILPVLYIAFRLLDPVFRVLEMRAGNLWLTKMIYIAELGVFSLGVFLTTFVVLVLFQEPLVMSFLDRLKTPPHRK